MDKKEITLAELEQMAALMAQAITDLDCPDCHGPIHEYVEISARFYQDEWEWACLAAVLTARAKRKAG